MVLVTQEGCNPCARVKRLLGELRPILPELLVREVPLDSEEGFELAGRYSILYPPAVIADGVLVGKGKIREEDLRRALGAVGPRGA